jgi:hypothetical protein
MKNDIKNKTNKDSAAQFGIREGHSLCEALVQ